MSTLDQSILESLDGTDPRLFPYLAELLQDLDDLGADPPSIERLLAAGPPRPDRTRVLDLGCGKGSVSLHLLERHPWTALGLDGMPAFIDRARTRAKDLGVASRCRFEVEDIRAWENTQTFDVIVLGAVGPVLGDTESTLRRLEAWLAPGGVVVLDEVYVPQGGISRNLAYHQTREDLLAAIGRAGFRLLEERRDSGDDTLERHHSMFQSILRRAEALAVRHPHERALFETYVAQQAQEFQVLETEIEAVTLLVARA